MAGITTSIYFDIDSYKESISISNELGISHSRFVQIAIRNQIKLHRKQSVQQYLDSLDNDELEILKKLIK